MRLACVLALLAPLLLMNAPAAEPPQSSAPADEAARAAERRVELFAALASAKTEADAREIEDKIWTLWLTAPDQEGKRLLEESRRAQLRFDYGSALAALTELTERSPDYAEGWNQRAIVLFLMGEYDLSLEAIERTLQLEPKHYAALAGKGIILLQQGRDAPAQQALRRALAIDPWLKERGLITNLPERKT
jgi:tetratricopeptide (TPR) repeat protein